MKKSKILFALMLVTLSVSNCRKDISVPNQEFEKLFGTWNWIESSGGFTGKSVLTPATEGHSSTIEFRKNGICVFDNGKRKDKMKFTLSEGKSIFSNSPSSLIKYEDFGLLDKDNTPMSQSIQFQGHDTLFLNDECYDCFGHMYVRMK